MILTLTDLTEGADASPDYCELPQPGVGSSLFGSNSKDQDQFEQEAVSVLCTLSRYLDGFLLKAVNSGLNTLFTGDL